MTDRLRLGTATTRTQTKLLLLDLTASIPGAVFRLALAADGSTHLIHASPGVQALFGVQMQDALHDAAAHHGAELHISAGLEGGMGQHGLHDIGLAHIPVDLQRLVGRLGVYGVHPMQHRVRCAPYDGPHAL